MINMSHREARELMKLLHPDMLRTEVVHHIDENPLNNCLDNLVIIDKWEHQKLHNILRLRRLNVK